MSNHRARACADAWRILNSAPVILSATAAGLSDNAGIIELAAVDVNGRLLLDTLVKPPCKIPDSIVHLYGISDDMVFDALDWPSICNNLQKLLRNRVLVSFDAQFMRSAMDAVSSRYGHSLSMYPYCAMELFSRYISKPEQMLSNGAWPRVNLNQCATKFEVPVSRTQRAKETCNLVLQALNNMSNRFRASGPVPRSYSYFSPTINPQELS